MRRSVSWKPRAINAREGERPAGGFRFNGTGVRLEHTLVATRQLLGFEFYAMRQQGFLCHLLHAAIVTTRRLGWMRLTGTVAIPTRWCLFIF